MGWLKPPTVGFFFLKKRSEESAGSTVESRPSRSNRIEGSPFLRTSDVDPKTHRMDNISAKDKCAVSNLHLQTI